MAKNPQVGAQATWDGPHKASNLKKGNPRYGMDPIQVSKVMPLYKAGPITRKAQ